MVGARAAGRPRRRRTDAEREREQQCPRPVQREPDRRRRERAARDDRAEEKRLRRRELAHAWWSSATGTRSRACFEGRAATTLLMGRVVRPTSSRLAVVRAVEAELRHRARQSRQEQQPDRALVHALVVALGDVRHERAERRERHERGERDEEYVNVEPRLVRRPPRRVGAAGRLAGALVGETVGGAPHATPLRRAIGEALGVNHRGVSAPTMSKCVCMYSLV